MPSPVYGVAFTIALTTLLIGPALLWGVRALPNGKRVRWTLVAVAWILGAIGLGLNAARSLGWTSVALAADWVLVGALVGIRLVRTRRKQRRFIDVPRGLDAPLPSPVLAALAQRGVGPEAVLASAGADLALSGEYAASLAVLLADRMLVYATSQESAELTREIPYDQIEQIRAEGLIGGGQLVVCITTAPGRAEPVMRYTNSRGREFGQIAKKLGEHVAPRTPDDTTERKPLSFKDADDLKRKSCPRCERRLEENTLVCPACINRGRVLTRLLKISGEYWKSIALLGVLLVVSSGTTLIQPWIHRYMIDEVFGSATGQATLWGWTVSTRAMLGILMIGIVGIVAFDSLLAMARGRVAVRVGARVGSDLRARVFHHLQVLSLGYFDSRRLAP